jgi:predicted aspartyl protease
METAMRLACLTLLAVAAAPLEAQLSTSTFDTVFEEQPVDGTTEADDVEFREDLNKRMTVLVHVGGSGPYRFLVDTGADRTAISRQIAALLDLEAGPRAALHAMTGASIVETAIIPNLQLSRNASRVIDAPLLDAKHMGADGILGVDLLRSQRVIFDFENRVMTIVPASKTATAREEGRVVVTGRLRKGRLIMTSAVADRTAVTVVLDTGSEVSIGNHALRRSLAKRGVLKGAGTTSLQSVTGDVLEGEYTFLKTLKVGEVELENLAIVFADAHTFKHLDLESRPALLLGMNALSAFKKVSIDFANKKLRVIFPDHGSREFFLMAQR